MGVMQMKGLPELEIGQDRWVSKPGRYPFVIASAEEGQTGKGFDKVVIRGQVEAPGTVDDGVSFFDHLAINGDSAAYFKRRLKQLGVPVESDGVTGEQICHHLLGKRGFVDLELEPAQVKDKQTGQLSPKIIIDGQGNRVQALQSRPTAYYQHAVGGQTAPAVQAAPQAAPVAPQAAPPGFGAPPGFPAQGAPAQGFAPPAGAGAVAPPGFGQAPQGFGAPPAQNGAPAGFGAPAGAPAPWAQPPASAPAAEATASGGGGRGRGKKQ